MTKAIMSNPKSQLLITGMVWLECCDTTLENIVSTAGWKYCPACGQKVEVMIQEESPCNECQEYNLDPDCEGCSANEEEVV